MKSPLLWVAIAYISGILFGNHFPSISTLEVSGIFVLFCFYLAWRYVDRAVGKVAFYLCVFLCGVIGIILKQSPIHASDLRNIFPDFEVAGSVWGEIEQVRSISYSYEDQDVQDVRWEIYLNVSSVQGLIHGSSRIPGVGVIRVVCRDMYINSPMGQSQPHWNPGAGDFIRVHGVISPVSRQMDRVIHRGCHFEISPSRQGRIEVLRIHDHPDAGFFDIARHGAIEALNRCFPADTRARRLLMSLGLGVREDLTKEDIQSFRETGTMHVFAISGLHVGLVATIIFRALQFFIWSRVYAALISIPIIWLYVGMVGAPPSATRAGMMATVVLVGMCCQRPDHWPNTLHCTALFHLLTDPGQLFDPGFQLSFLAVFWIIAVLPGFADLVRNVSNTDPLLPASLTPWWRIKWQHCLGQLVSLTILSLVCWLGLLPLTALIFGEVYWVGILLNLVLVPMAGISLLSLILGWIFGWSGGWVDGAFFHSAWFVMQGMIRLADSACQLSGGGWTPAVNTPAYWGIYFVWLILIVIFRKSRKLWWRGLRAGIGMCLLLYLVVDPDKPGDVPEITSISWSGSQVVVLRIPQAAPVMIHCGGDRMYRAISRTLEKLDNSKPPHILLVHASARQMGGFEKIFNHYPNTQFYFDDRRNFRSPSWQKLRQSHSNNSDGRIHDLGTFTAFFQQFTFVTPEKWEEYLPLIGSGLTRASDLPSLVHWDNGTSSALICPPLSREAQLAMVNSGSVPAADLLVCTMDEAAVPLEPWFVHEVAPNIILVGDSLFPAERTFTADKAASWKKSVAPADVLIQSSIASEMSLKQIPHSWEPAHFH